MSRQSYSSVGKFIGPAIPDNIAKAGGVSESHKQNRIVSDDDDDDDDYAIGPSLYLKASEKDQASALLDFEQRAKKMKDKLEGKVCIQRSSLTD